MDCVQENTITIVIASERDIDQVQDDLEGQTGVPLGLLNDLGITKS